MKTEEEYDYVTIGESEYSGTMTIDAILSSNFTVHFLSDKRRTEKGFNLNWNCLKWEEWTRVGRGTCLEMTKPQPEYNGEDVKKYTKYRDINETCGKFIKFYYYIIGAKCVIGDSNRALSGQNALLGHIFSNQ